MIKCDGSDGESVGLLNRVADADCDAKSVNAAMTPVKTRRLGIRVREALLLGASYGQKRSELFIMSLKKCRRKSIS